MRIEGRTALVTGAGRGLGVALVVALVERGASRVYAGLRGTDVLPAALAPYGDRTIGVRLDVTSDDDRRAAAERCADVELLVSNAGLAPHGPLLETTDQELRETFEVNVFGPLALVQALAPALRAHAGGVLFVNSLTGLVVSRSSPVYGASKAAARMMALALRAQLAADGVVVTTSHPGFIDTDMATGMPYPKATPQEVAERSLAAWEAEATVVFPDAFAELVEDALLHRQRDVLDEPQQTMTGLVARLVEQARDERS